MSAPASATLDPAVAVEFSVATETPVSIKYKLWLRRNDAWTPVGPETTSDDRSDHWIFAPPTPAGSVFAYWLGVWGPASLPWRARITISQPSANGIVTRATWTETGILSDMGNGLGVDAINIVKVPLQ